MISVPQFDDQRLSFHAVRQTLRKAEMARLALREWLNYHDSELEDWKARKASELGMTVSEFEQELLVEVQGQQKKGEDDTDSETIIC